MTEKTLELLIKSLILDFLQIPSRMANKPQRH